MTNATVTTTAPADTTAAAPVAAAPKAPSKKSLALVIFNEQMALRAAGKFASNKEFRATVLARIVAELEVTIRQRRCCLLQPDTDRPAPRQLYVQLVQRVRMAQRHASRVLERHGDTRKQDNRHHRRQLPMDMVLQRLAREQRADAGLEPDHQPRPERHRPVHFALNGILERHAHVLRRDVHRPGRRCQLHP